MECPICYDSGTLDKLKCSHLVCKLCISKLINRVCPFCRVSIDDENSEGVFHEEVDFESGFISTEIYTIDFSRPTRRLRRRRARDHNREVEDIITHIFSIPLDVSFIDLEDTRRDSEVSENTRLRRKSSRRKSSRRKSSREYWKTTSAYPRRRRAKRSKR